LKKKLDIHIENLDKERIPFSKKIIRDIVFYLGDFFGIKRGEFNLYFINKRIIRNLNRVYLKRDCPTDVLVFDLGKKDNLLLEIFICTKVARENAFLYKNSFKKEITLYIIHGFLHALGFEDRDKENKKIMFDKQNTLLDLISNYIRAKYKINL